MKKKNNSLIYVAIAVLSILLVFGIVILVFDPFSFFAKEENEVVENNNNKVTEVVDKKEKALVNTLWETNRIKSDDYVGTITFESGLIDLPFVQGSDNNTYYRTDWESMKYDEEGSIFLDSSNTLDDQNLILIGHYVYASYDASGTHKFTPLAKLIDKENYENNKYVKLYLENEVRRYEIAYVYYCELIEDEYEGEKFSYTNDGFEFYYPNYTEEQFDKYIDTVKKNAFYDTGVSITYNDKLLTLQTCVENHNELREIVLLKEVDRTSYK
ncbi:MAG: class B sortase [Erysipelotrichaceae bacterium]|nr:class B sortase [Erysipelotrichaceae bacterium]